MAGAEESSPLVGLAVAAVQAMLYMLDEIKNLVAWLTITLPSMVVRMLQYSFTISLTFPILLSLFLAALTALIFQIRYRYLARYTQLKEPALPPPSPPSLNIALGIENELLPLSAKPRTGAPFHNYLDDFLAAIRIFGFLEKPVFHELSRHLQTRRLMAGETLEIGGGEFWCVVEGRVQVFAPASEEDLSRSPSPDPFSSSFPPSFNGYHLLNEVSTGGTLSSLFSILSLFTEDIKLSWSPDPPSPDDMAGEDTMVMEEQAPPGKRDKSPADSDVSRLDESALGRRRVASPVAMSPITPIAKQRSSSFSVDSGSTGPSTLQDGDQTASASLPNTQSPSPTIPSPPRRRNSAGPSRGRTGQTIRPDHTLPLNDSPRPAPRRRRADPEMQGSSALKGTIARATVDTTLAVIPAEAFRKLTRKFPKASGTVVQVVLERFSRVTFMTAHKFLGLTREILRSESSLNHLVSHPLPREFYTQGGMQALRARFEPESAHRAQHGPGESRPFPLAETSPQVLPHVHNKDYFNYVPASPTVRAPSLPSVTPKFAMTPAARSKDLHAEPEAFSKIKEGEGEDKGTHVPGIGSQAAAMFSPDTALRHTSTFVRRTSAMRKQVAAGDLAMTQQMPDDGGAYYRPTAQTPALPRNDTWRGRLSGSASDLAHTGMHVDSPEEGDSEMELREAVVACIAQSIGLVQPSLDSAFDSLSRNSFAPSVSALSTPNSPMFPPNGKAGGFGNVLDMMNASKHDDNILGGMLREAALARAQGDDDASSIPESSMMGGTKSGLGGVDPSSQVLRDLEGKVEVLYFKRGSKLVKEGEKSPGIYYVIDGFLEVSLPTNTGSLDGNEPKASARDTSPAAAFSSAHGRPFGAALGLDEPESPQNGKRGASGRAEDEALFTVKPGGIAGYLASLCATDSYVNITAKTDCFVGFIPTEALAKIIERRPIVLLTLAKRLLSLLSPLVLHIDAALDWMQLGAGQVLYEQGDRSTDFYIVINGRLRALDSRGDSPTVLREYGQLDSLGELDVITAVPRSETVHAIRDSELVRIPAALFDAISVRHPATTVQFMRLIAGRVRKAMGEEGGGVGLSMVGAGGRGGDGRARADLNLKTVCVLGTNRAVPVAHFAGKLKNSLEELGASTSYLDQGTVMRHLGRHAFARIGKLKIAGWLADQEQHYRTVLYVADTPPASQWTLTCIRQADLILVVAMGDDPSLGEYEKLMLATKTTARKELILLHDERFVAPGSTRQWLKNRPWLGAHHHIELPGVVTPHKTNPPVHDPAAIAAFKHLRERVEIRIKKYRGLRPLHRPRRPPHLNDFARIARRLCGKQIGLVLGGGGARGISHIGMLQALEEFGVPVDAIGGCSIGSFVGGLYARGADLLETRGRTKQFAGRMGSMLRILSDVTYPFVAYTTGHEFNRGIYKAFYNTHIEDFWIPFFANSTNITHSRMEVHRSGYAWRYVRASMTLAGLLPPLSDNGNLLVDGGYMDNTPIGPLRAMGIRDIIVVDVGSVDDTTPRHYGDSVSGWWIFINKFNPFYERKVLSMTEVSSRLAYVSSVKTLEDVKTDPHCLYLAMPVQQFETLGGFKQFSEVLAVGLDSARGELKKWKDDGKLPSGFVDDTRGRDVIQRNTRLRRMSI